MFFPTLAYNKETIITMFDMLCRFAIQISLTNHMVKEKTIILRGNLLKIQNAYQSIFLYKDKASQFDKFDLFEPTTNLFHLQMNLLKMFFYKL